MRAKGYSETALLTELTEINARDCNPPLDPEELMSIAKSVERYRPNKNFDFSDVGNGRRLVAAYETSIRYVPELKQWFIWDGVRWCEDGDGEMHRLAKAMTDQMLAEAAAMKGALDV
jgi:putative DNA primase/helicase